MSNDRETLSALLLTFLRPPRYSGGSWTYSPDEAADAVLASTWLAERDRQVAEQALRDAAEYVVQMGLEFGTDRLAFANARHDVADWLNARADSAAPARPTTDDRRWADKVADGCAEAARAALASRPTTPTPTVSEEWDA